MRKLVISKKIIEPVYDWTIRLRYGVIQ
jgi:hypothetical protein